MRRYQGLQATMGGGAAIEHAVYVYFEELPLFVGWLLVLEGGFDGGGWQSGLRGSSVFAKIEES